MRFKCASIQALAAEDTNFNLRHVFAAQTAKVELVGFGLGDRIAADASVLIGISYEPAVDTFTLFLEGLQHRVHHPKSINVDADLDVIHSIEVVDAEDVHHIIQFRPALELPAP